MRCYRLPPHEACRWFILQPVFWALLTAATAIAAPPAPQGDPQLWSSYNQGLMAMRDGRLPDAVTALSAALQRSPEPRVYLARAVAQLLQQKFDDALSDLSHANVPAQPGQRPSREPDLLRLCIWAMTDKPPQNAERGANWFSGIPGHMIQGGDDYPTDYASFLAYNMAMAYRSLRESQGDLHNPEMQAIMRSAGQWFANRILATAPMAAFNLQYAQQLLDKNQLPAALDAVNLAKLVFPFDADVRYVCGEASRRLGRPETARREFTVALTMATDMAVAYRGRALAAAAEGDAHRAQEDLRLAAKYEPKSTGDAPQMVAALLAKDPVNDDPTSLLTRLDAAAAAPDGSVDSILPIALALQRSAAAKRVRYDELYQDHLRELEDATRVQAPTADAFVAVAAYLLDELPNRGEAVEPRRGAQHYRYQYSQAMEISRALFALKRALQINPRSAPALVRLAFAYDANGQPDKAEESISQAMQLVGTQNADAVRLLAQYRAAQIGNLQSRASRLRTPQFVSNTHTENRSDGVYNVTVTTRYDPSPADLQSADECDRQARVLMNQAKAMMEAAIKSNPASLEGMLLQSAYQNWFGTAEDALRALQQAVAKYPNSLVAHDALIDFDLTHGRIEQAIDERMIASRLFQTTAGPLLERIWRHVRENGWPALTKDLQRAREIDPADARTSAYLAAAQFDAQQSARSNASLRVAIALELARLRLDDQGDGATLPRPAADFALVMRLLENAGLRAGREGRADQAVADCRAAASFAARFATGGRSELMFGAMIPDPNAAAIPVPAPVNGATLAAGAYVAAGELLKVQNRSREAVACFQAAAAFSRPYKSNIPMVGNAAGETNFSEFATGPVIVTAWFELAQTQISAGNYQAALDALNNAGAAQPDRKRAAEINELMLQVTNQLNERPQQQQPPRKGRP